MCFLKYLWEVSVLLGGRLETHSLKELSSQCEVLDFIYSCKASLLSSFVLLLNPLILYHFLLQCTQHFDTFFLAFL